MSSPSIEIAQDTAPWPIPGTDVAPAEALPIEDLNPSGLPVAVTAAMATKKDPYLKAQKKAAKEEKEEEDNPPAGPAITQVPTREQQKKRGQEITYGEGHRWSQALISALGSLGLRPAVF